MNWLINALTAPTNILWAALISAILSTVIASLSRLGEVRDKARVDYEYAQRKALSELVGRNIGGVLNAAESMSHRLWNLYQNHGQSWLVERNGYYLQSSVYRFLALAALLRQVAGSAILLDARLSAKREFTFLNYVAALHWVMTDVSLFDGLIYDAGEEKDHFFSDNYRTYADLCWSDGKVLTFDAFKEKIANDEKAASVINFFMNLKPEKDRYRWDRLVALHLLLLAFINTFGYKRQFSEQSQFDEVAGQIRHQKVLSNLLNWLDRHDAPP